MAEATLIDHTLDDLRAILSARWRGVEVHDETRDELDEDYRRFRLVLDGSKIDLTTQDGWTAKHPDDECGPASSPVSPVLAIERLLKNMEARLKHLDEAAANLRSAWS